MSCKIHSIAIFLQLWVVYFITHVGKSPSCNNYHDPWALHNTHYLEVETTPPIAMRMEDTHHFSLERNAEADAQWAAQYPNNGIVYLGPDKLPYTVSMFHEIRCLDVLRIETLRLHDNNYTSSPSRLSLHCLRFLRQAVMYRGDMGVEETFQLPVGPQMGTYFCNDWTKVYEVVTESHRSF